MFGIMFLNDFQVFAEAHLTWPDLMILHSSQLGYYWFMGRSCRQVNIWMKMISLLHFTLFFLPTHPPPLLSSFQSHRCSHSSGHQQNLSMILLSTSTFALVLDDKPRHVALGSFKQAFIVVGDAVTATYGSVYLWTRYIHITVSIWKNHNSTDE